MVHANPDRNFSLGIFAYHLYKPSTNRFSHVNGKQPLSLESHRVIQDLLLFLSFIKMVGLIHLFCYITNRSMAIPRWGTVNNVP